MATSKSVRYTFSVYRRRDVRRGKAGTSGMSSGVSPLLTGSSAGRAAGQHRHGVPAPDVPDAALADLFDRARQSIRGIVPVRLDGALRAARVTFGDSRGDHVVLAHGRRQLVEQHV